jgi:leader peptidase (prepilin peptidase)/N-methyltransferase
MTPEILLPAVGVFGLMIGSFLNVCIARLPLGQSVVSPGSRCPGCRAPIAWYDNIPVVSYVLLRARCRRCGAAISARYVLVEVVTALAFVGQAALMPEVSVGLASRLVLTALLVALAATDLETFRLPNPLTLGGLAAGLIFSVFGPPGPMDAALGVLAGGGILLAIRWAWLSATGTDAMGLGDVKMLAMIGAFLGWQQVFVVLLLSTVVGALVGVGVSVARRGTLQTRLPFGVFLAVAAYAASVVGGPILAWYLGLMTV